MLSPKPNGSTLEEDDGLSKANKTTIRWMWKKAFKSLKTKDRDKDKEVKDRDDRSDKSSDREEKRYSRMNSRQSSVKKLLKRKDSKEQPVQEEEQETNDEVGEIDPVYSLLKCAADLPRQSKMGPGHACCLQRGNDSLTVRGNSRSSSPSSERPSFSLSTPSSPLPSSSSTASLCSCPCHTPEVLASYHIPFLNSFIIKKS